MRMIFLQTLISFTMPVAAQVAGSGADSALSVVFARVAAVPQNHITDSTKPDPYKSVFFTLDDSRTVFKLRQTPYRLFLYRADNEQQNITRGNYLVADAMPPDLHMALEDFAASLFAGGEQYGLVESSVKNIVTKRINGSEAHEVEIHGKDSSGRSIVVYLCLAGSSRKSVLLQGYAVDNVEVMLRNFRELADTLRFK